MLTFFVVIAQTALRSSLEMSLARSKLCKTRLKPSCGTSVSLLGILTRAEKNTFIEDALVLPVPAQYRALLSSLRFDYMDMQEAGDYKHHYKSTAAQNMSPPPSKMVRLA